jgi:hypothetical protein
MWVAVAKDDEMHIIPENDLIEHTLSDDCVCGPELTDLGEGQVMVTHASLDGREFEEPDWQP